MYENDWRQLQEHDKTLATVAQNAGIVYLSPLTEFCISGVCEIRVSNNLPEGLIVDAVDHLTGEGSIKFFRSSSVSNSLKNFKLTNKESR